MEAAAEAAPVDEGEEALFKNKNYIPLTQGYGVPLRTTVGNKLQNGEQKGSEVSKGEKGIQVPITSGIHLVV